VPSARRPWLPEWTIFDSDVERRDETPAFPAEQKYGWRLLAGTRLTLAAAWDELGN
jgi:hypothetical protein